MIALFATALLAFAQPAEAKPIDVTLLVDVSDSMTLGPHDRDVDLVTEIGRDVALRLANGDVARIGAFGSRIVISPAVADPKTLRLAASQLIRELGGSSPIWDAVAEAVKTIPNGSRRRGIVVITDGRATGNRMGFTDLLTMLKDTSVPVFIVSYDPWKERQIDRTQPNPDPGARLKRLAEVTGGTYVVVVKRKALAAAVAQAVNTLRER